MNHMAHLSNSSTVISAAFNKPSAHYCLSNEQ